MELTGDMSELIGAIMGDGNIYEPNSCIEITGHLSDDRNYFYGVLAKIIQNELDYNPRIFTRPDSLKIRINKKMFVTYLKNLGIPTGKGKSLTVLIPDRIYANPENVTRCIRGVYDTDGSVTFDKRKTYLRPYPRVVLHISNLNLIKQIATIFLGRGLRPKISYKESSLYLNGIEQVSLFLRKIGFSNSKHLDRLKRFYPTLIQLNCVNASVAQW